MGIIQCRSEPRGTEVTQSSAPVFHFHKSSYSDAELECVEVSTTHPHLIAIRDSKNPTAPTIQTTPTAWTAFTTALTRGHFTPGP
ncbi:DUF397 domain-containing protein [Streptomyces sp. NPDC003077]|uniref:DUF397 domain-containing protein n=1 Tax=Streptomyces sp. NPDC003077 TaxID=3154443 RepID=UPI0033B23F3B